MSSLAFYSAMQYTIVQSEVLRICDCRSSVRPSVCLSVCPSVTLVDQEHIRWKSSKLIARTISATPSLFVAQRPSTYSHGDNLARLEVGWGKLVCWRTKAAISLKRVKIEEMEGL